MANRKSFPFCRFLDGKWQRILISRQTRRPTDDIGHEYPPGGSQRAVYLEGINLPAVPYEVDENVSVEHPAGMCT